MGADAEIKRLIREIAGTDAKSKSMVVLVGEVVSIEAESCTVKIDDLEIPDVRLKATINEASDYLLLKPKKGTMVMMISLTGQMDDLAVIRCDEVEFVEYKQNGLNVLIDSKDKKVSVKNDNVSLVDLFTQIKDIITNLKVLTPSGPSTGLLPDTVTALTQFTFKFKQLLK